MQHLPVDNNVAFVGQLASPSAIGAFEIRKKAAEFATAVIIRTAIMSRRHLRPNFLERAVMDVPQGAVIDELDLFSNCRAARPGGRRRLPTAQPWNGCHSLLNGGGRSLVADRCRQYLGRRFQ